MPGRHTDLRQLARRIFDAALCDADAALAVRRAIRLDASTIKIFDAEFDARALDVFSIALGKAAEPMARALDEILGARLLRAGVVTAPPLTAPLSARWSAFAGGHPLPNDASLEAARAALSLVSRADERASAIGPQRTLIIFLVSGGGSAMLELPRVPAITSEDLRVMNHVLVTCGAHISEINAVRRAVSAVKGGRLALAAPRASQITLLISDVGAGEERGVASGPTFPSDERQDALAARCLVKRYDLDARLPTEVLRAIEEAAGDDQGEKGVSETRKSAPGEEGALRRHFVLLDNARAVECAAAMARAEGFAVEITHDITDENVAAGARLLVSRLFELRERAGGAGRGACIVSGGEFACPVGGAGAGGRNSETALRCALELDALTSHSHSGEITSSREITSAAETPDRDSSAAHSPRVVALFAGTDGIDGNSPAAGALCDETTIARARALGLDPHRFLERSDSHTFFAALGDTLTTGPTGTNVRDLRILLSQ